MRDLADLRQEWEIYAQFGSNDTLGKFAAEGLALISALEVARGRGRSISGTEWIAEQRDWIAGYREGVFHFQGQRSPEVVALVDDLDHLLDVAEAAQQVISASEAMENGGRGVLEASLRIHYALVKGEGELLLAEALVRAADSQSNPVSRAAEREETSAREGAGS